MMWLIMSWLDLCGCGWVLLPGNLQREELLMQGWFALITEKNGLERREQELNLL